MSLSNPRRLNRPTLQLCTNILNGLPSASRYALPLRGLILEAARPIVAARVWKEYRRAKDKDIEELIAVGLMRVTQQLHKYNPKRSAFGEWVTFTADAAIKVHLQRLTPVHITDHARREEKRTGQRIEVHTVDVSDAPDLSTEAPSALDALVHAQDLERLRDALERLRPVHRHVISQLHGLETPDGQRASEHTLAGQLGLKVVEVQAIHQQALEELRQHLTADEGR